jgi:hypothetical protein
MSKLLKTAAITFGALVLTSSLALAQAAPEPGATAPTTTSAPHKGKKNGKKKGGKKKGGKKAGTTTEPPK